ncbi:MAG: hypothetical protein I8H75_00360 [Myxococcaceae bacterium]|nr:hypothetical protein [Myxococcaceae bacterium]MBH2005797.1 hypothetical protein [Myxococcaceae bacterium]
MMRLFLALLIVILGNGCGTHPASQTLEQQRKAVKLFFADTLDPDPADTHSELPFKDACFKHLEALYFIINSEDALNGLPEELIARIPPHFQELKKQSLETIFKALVKQDDDFYRSHQKAILSAVEEIQMEFDALKNIQVPKLGIAWTEFFTRVLANYFPSLPLEDKTRLLAFSFRQFDPELDSSQNLLNWIYASGPFFQKYLQLMAEYLEPGDNLELKKFKSNLMRIKEGLPSIHDFYQEQYLAELRSKGVDLEILRSLGAASVGEAYLARDRSTGAQLVIKFQRPGIRQIAERERLFFAKQAHLPALKKSFEQIEQQIREELNYLMELEKIEQGAQAYEGDEEHPIQVVRPIQGFPHTQNYFAMEFIDGKTFLKLGHTHAEKLLKTVLWNHLSWKFMHHALWELDEKKVFFHGDLHDGNIMVLQDARFQLNDQTTQAEIEAAYLRGYIQLVLIDFGNAHKLDHEARKRLKDTFLSCTKLSHSAQEFLSAYNRSLQGQNHLLAQLEQDAFKEENRSNLQAHEKLGMAMDTLLEEGFAVDGTLMAFYRSLGMLLNIRSELQEATTLHTIAQEVYTKDLNQLVDEASPEMLNSLLNGIVLRAESADWESEILGSFLNNPAFIPQWSLFRKTWGQPSAPGLKQDLLYQALDDFILESFLPQISDFPGWILKQAKSLAAALSVRLGFAYSNTPEHTPAPATPSAGQKLFHQIVSGQYTQQALFLLEKLDWSEDILLPIYQLANGNALVQTLALFELTWLSPRPLKWLLIKHLTGLDENSFRFALPTVW